MQVERAKKCLDFSFTAYFIHFVACTLYAGFPKQWQWLVFGILPAYGAIELPKHAG